MQTIRHRRAREANPEIYRLDTDPRALAPSSSTSSRRRRRRGSSPRRTEVERGLETHAEDKGGRARGSIALPWARRYLAVFGYLCGRGELLLFFERQVLLAARCKTIQSLFSIRRVNLCRVGYMKILSSKLNIICDSCSNNYTISIFIYN